MRFPVMVAGLLFAAATALAEPHKEFPRVDDTSRTEASGDRLIQLSVEVKGSPAEVWESFTTSAGWKSFAVGFANVDFRVGGIIETSYNAQAKVGDPDNIKNEILAYVPGRMLAFRCVQAPRSFQHKEEFFSTPTVIEIQPLAGGGARLVGTSTGFRPGAAYDDLYAKFRWGNAYTFEKLRQKFDPTKAAPTTPAPGSGRVGSGEAK